MNHASQELLPANYVGNTRVYQESLPAAPTAYVGIGYTDRVIRIKELAEIIGLSRGSIYLRLDKKSKYWDPNFPRPIRLGKGSVGWLLSSIQQWLSAQPQK